MINSSKFENTALHDGVEPEAMPWLIFGFLLILICQALNIAVSPFVVLEWLKTNIIAWMYLFDGPRIIETGYNEANGKPYEVFAPDSRYVFVTSSTHIKELDSAPDTVLSLQAASKQMLQPMYTMHGFNWFDRRGTEGVGFVRALRTLLTKNLPQILPDLSTIVKSRFDELHAEHIIINGRKHSPVYPVIVKLVVLSNAVSFFGKDLAKNDQFLVSALAYIEETLMCAEIVRLLPKAAAPYIGRLIARYNTSHETIYSTLLPIAEQRCQERDLAILGRKVPEHADCIQWIMETAPRQKPWTPTRVVHELMAIWFGSVHALSTTITFAIHDICVHPEYVGPLRNEANQGYAQFERTGVGLPLLDSFIKESARLTPVESMSTRRFALKPFSFSDGTKLAVGDWACTPVRAIMQNPAHFPEPLTFSGFRFASLESLKGTNMEESPNISQNLPSKLVDVDDSWHVWGTGRMACPGRYYATAIIKVIMAQIIMEFDCQLVDPGASRWFTWRSSMLPRKNTMVVFTAHSAGPQSQ